MHLLSLWLKEWSFTALSYFKLTLLANDSPVLKNVFVPLPNKFWPKVPPHRARYRDNDEFATKVRNLVVFWEGTLDSKSLFKRGNIWLFESSPKMFQGAHLRISQTNRIIESFAWFATKARMPSVKCAFSNSYVQPPLPMGAVGVTLKDRNYSDVWQMSVM